MTDKEKLEEAKRLYQTANADQRYVLEILFPELKEESEDERIRKELIDIVAKSPITFAFEDKGKVLAWLEKQGQEKQLSEPIKDYQGSFTCWNNAHDFRPKHLQRCICYDKYMGGVYCYVYDDISKYWCTQTTEEHDPDGDNHISDYSDYRVTAWMPLPDTSFYPSKSLLEKQGREKPADKVEPKFKVGDTMRTLQEASNGITEGTPVVVSIDNEHYRCNNETIAIKDQNNYEYPPINKRHNAWSEEDENTIKVLMNIIRKSEIIDSIIYTDSLKEKLYDWLKSLRPQPKQEWSTEDEKMLNRIIEDFSDGKVSNILEVYWLKSIKQRIRG